MERGRPKRQLPSEKKARGTYRPHRDDHVVELVEPGGMPTRPDWLTPEAEEVWMDDIGRVSAHQLIGEKDATAFANYCVLQGALIKAIRGGSMPPIAAFTEVRRMQELFGIAGARSRLNVVVDPQAKNPFSRNGRRPPPPG